MDYYKTLKDIKFELSRHKYQLKFKQGLKDYNYRTDYNFLIFSTENKITHSFFNTINIDDIKPLRDHIDKACPELSVEVRKYLAKKFRDSIYRPVYLTPPIQLTRSFRDKVIEGVTWGAVLGSLLLALYVILK